jgi:amidase
LANSFDDLEFLVHHVIDAKPWNKDSMALAIPWRASTAVARPNIRIGFFRGDADFPIHPPVARALDASVKKLTAAGFTVVPLAKTPSLKAGLDLAEDYYSLDNTKTFLQYINRSGEPMIPSLQKTIHTINKKSSYTLEELFDINAAKALYRAAWNKVWVGNELDVILCPGAANTAVLHDNYGPPPYTAVWNLLEVCTASLCVLLFRCVLLMASSTRVSSSPLIKPIKPSILKILRRLTRIVAGNVRTPVMFVTSGLANNWMS